MKKILITFLSAACFKQLTAQNVGIGTSAPMASAALDVTSTTKGFLTPRMTTSQRINISVPAKGLLVYDTDVNALYHYNGSAWATVASGSVNFSLPYAGSFTSASPVFSIENTGSGEGITASSNGSFTAAIEGAGNGTGGYGVVGKSVSPSGYGVYGLNTSGTAVYGFSSGGGVALRGNSPTGYALLTNGNLRLTGGNTNPDKGAVLTSVDAQGNAVWKQKNIGFSVNTAKNTSIAQFSEVKVEFENEEFDLQNNFVPYAGATTSGSSKFTAPVAGVYNFSAYIEFVMSSSINNFTRGFIFLFKNGSNVASSETVPLVLPLSSKLCLSINANLYLNANDQVWLVASQQSDNGNAHGLNGSPQNGRFSGYLLFAD